MDTPKKQSILQMKSLNATQYVMPESALKQAQQYTEDGDWKAAAKILAQALQNRRAGRNSVMLERVMVSRRAFLSWG